MGVCPYFSLSCSSQTLCSTHEIKETSIGALGLRLGLRAAVLAPGGGVVRGVDPEDWSLGLQNLLGC